MTSYLSNSDEQALLAMVVAEAHPTIRQSKTYLGRTALQKIMYFLKALGVPMQYRFDVYYYGPFCQDILMDMDWLIADEIVKDASRVRERYSNYAAGPALEDFLSQHKDLEKHRDTVRTVTSVLAPLRPDRLELISTLHYLFRKLKASHAKQSDKFSVVNEFMRVKGKRFRKSEVEKTFDKMQQAGFFNAQ